MNITQQKPQRGPKPKIRSDIRNKQSYDDYRREFNSNLLSKKSLINIIYHAVNEYTVSAIHYLMFGFRHHYVRFIKDIIKQYDCEKYCEIAALRALKTFIGNNRGEFSFV